MFIYKITDETNGRIYVGQTTRSIEVRFEEHTKADSYIGDAIRKHGRENFKIEILEVCQSLEELNEREQFWITELQSKPPNGYNLTDGGDCSWTSKSLGTGWIGLYQEAADMLAEWKLTTEQYRVFLKLLARLDFDNYLRISHTNMAEELGMKRSAVSRAMKALEDLNVIMEGPRAGLNKTYRLNPYIAHKGRERDRTIKETNFGEGLTLIRGGKNSD